MYDFIRIATASPKTIVANCNSNAQQIIEKINQANDINAQVLVFPELSISSYTAGDLFYQTNLLNSALNSLGIILTATQDIDTLVIIGMPLMHNNKLYNCAVAIHKAEIIGIVPKSIIQTTGSSTECRWFTSGANIKSETITIFGQYIEFGTDLIFNLGEKAKLGIEIGSDLLSPIPQSINMSLAGVDIIVNLSAEVETVNSRDSKRELIKQQSARCISAYAICNAGSGESTTDGVFGAHNIIAENGEILAETNSDTFNDTLIYSDIDISKIKSAKLKNRIFSECASKFESDFIEIDVDIDCEFNNFDQELAYPLFRNPFIANTDINKLSSEIIRIQVESLKKRLLHINCKTAVIGISGGLDSTLTLLSTVKTFDELGYDRKNIYGISMPGFGTSDRTFDNSVNLMKSLGITNNVISIKACCEQHFKDINHDINNRNIAYENAQARERTQILLDIANDLNGIVVGTGDLSEVALGWCTFNGDHIANYCFNAGVPKTLIRTTVTYFANLLDATTSKILLDIVNTPISPELLPTDEKGNMTQKTEDKVGPYELHDFFIYNILKYGFSKDKILYLAKIAFSKKETESDVIYDAEAIEKWLNTCYSRFITQQFKRNCSIDGPQIFDFSLSPRGGYTLPSDASNEVFK